MKAASERVGKPYSGAVEDGIDRSVCSNGGVTRALPATESLRAIAAPVRTDNCDGRRSV